MSSVKVNVGNYTRILRGQTAATNFLLPVFEAIVNSIQAIDAASRDDGIVTVTVHRVPQPALPLGRRTLEPVVGFSVRDNGVGFNDDNFESFTTASSSQKLQLGGKGMGRFSWLVAFDSAEIVSHFRLPAGEMATRKFKFRPTKDGTEGGDIVEASDSVDTETIVDLKGFNKKFQDPCPKAIETLARRIIEHCLSYFLSENCPQIVLEDSSSGEVLNLNSMFNSEYGSSGQEEQFDIKGYSFVVKHFHLSPGDNPSHRLVFVADRRASKVSKLKDLENAGSIRDGAKSWIYAGYVYGKFLDEKINNDRTAFLISEKSSGMIEEEISWEDIVRSVEEKVELHLRDYIRPIIENNMDRIRSYVNGEKPIYRPLLKHAASEVEKIPPGLSDYGIEMELHKLYLSYEGELRRKCREVMTPSSRDSVDNMHLKLMEFVKEYCDTGTAKLAEYVAYRKAVIALLESSIEFDRNQRFGLEKAIHTIIFPMKVTSDGVMAENVNLWVVDDRLAYHDYLSSDLSFSQMKDRVVVDGLERPDLLMFQTTSAFSEGASDYASITIIEFKRPERDDYSASENPITQVNNYVRKIRAGEVRTTRGRRIEQADKIQIYAYIIADLTDALCTMASDAQMKQSPDRLRFFGYHTENGCYIEIIDFSKLISDAKKRNDVFFQKLGIQ